MTKNTGKPQRTPWLCVIGAVAVMLSPSASAGAEETEPEHRLLKPPLPQVIFQPPTIQLSDFHRGICANGQAGNSDRTISPEGMTVPSLWWTRDILMSKSKFNAQLIEGWLVCEAAVQHADARVCAISPARPGRVEMLVNTQLWAQLDYLSRYEFLARFGAATRECGYNIYVFNTETTLIADFTCQFQSDQADQSSHHCVLRPNLVDKGGLRPPMTDEFFPTDYRIDVF